MNKVIFILSAILLLVQGCAIGPQFHVNVDSISAPEATSKTKYVLLPGVKGVEVTDLQYREYSGYVERALNSIGYTQAPNFSEANIAIFLGYGIGEPQTQQYSYSLPTWGKTGVSSANTYGTATTYGNTTSVNATTIYTPSYGIIGSTIHIGSRTIYLCYMWLDAIDLDEYRETEKEVQLWKTTVTSTGSSSDLRQVFPILVAASKPYISSNTGKKIQVVISENDKQIIEVKGLSQK